MLKTAYQLGVRQAMAEAGLDKEAFAPLAVLRALGGGVASGVRSAGRNLGDAVATMRQARNAARISARPLPAGVTGVPGAATAAQEALQAARMEVLKKALPFLAVPAGAGAIYGGHKGLQALYPKAFASHEEEPGILRNLANELGIGSYGDPVEPGILDQLGSGIGDLADSGRKSIEELMAGTKPPEEAK